MPSSMIISRRHPLRDLFFHWPCGDVRRIFRFPRGKNRRDILHWTCSKNRTSLMVPLHPFTSIYACRVFPYVGSICLKRNRRNEYMKTVEKKIAVIAYPFIRLVLENKPKQTTTGSLTFQYFLLSSCKCVVEAQQSIAQQDLPSLTRPWAHSQTCGSLFASHRYWSNPIPFPEGLVYLSATQDTAYLAKSDLGWLQVLEHRYLLPKEQMQRYLQRQTKLQLFCIRSYSSDSTNNSSYRKIRSYGG